MDVVPVSGADGENDQVGVWLDKPVGTFLMKIDASRRAFARAVIVQVPMLKALALNSPLKYAAPVTTPPADC